MLCIGAFFMSALLLIRVTVKLRMQQRADGFRMCKETVDLLLCDSVRNIIGHEFAGFLAGCGIAYFASDAVPQRIVAPVIRKIDAVFLCENRSVIIRDLISSCLFCISSYNDIFRSSVIL